MVGPTILGRRPLVEGQPIGWGQGSRVKNLLLWLLEELDTPDLAIVVYWLRDLNARRSWVVKQRKGTSPLVIGQ